MFDNLKKKLKGFSLRNIFTRKAAAPVPKEIVENKDVQKAVIRHRRRKRWRRLRNVLLCSAALSTVLQYNPDWVATPFDQYMETKGQPADLKDHFHAANIYVYDRHNPLYPFHLAGNETKLVWQEGLQRNQSSAIGLAIATPFIYTGGLWKGFMDMLPGNKLDAYSMANDAAPGDRTVFIRPPGDFSVERFLSDFSDIEAGRFHFKSDPVLLQRALFEFVMLHEARHGDQQKLAYVTANEADADLYAFKVMAARGTDPALLLETVEIVTHARAINALLHDDDMHVSTFAVLRGGQTILDAHQDAAAFRRLAGIVEEADQRNDAVFSARMPYGNRYYHLTAALYRGGMLDDDPAMKDAAAAYINAIHYFNSVSGGQLVKGGFDAKKLNLKYLEREYVPVPDRLHPAPRPPRPNS
jgi:hypothetical protein